MKLFGHPVHVILIHFPSALFPMDFVCALIAVYTGNGSFNDSAFYASVGGVLAGWLAALAGVVDLAGVAKNKPKSLNTALLHGGINSTVLLGYTILDFLAWKHYPSLTNDSTIKLVVKGALIVLLLVGNYCGGSLILKDKVGVENET